MKRILFAATALAILGAAVTPASAQGVGVQIGPLGVGVGPGYWPYDHGYYYGPDYAYAPDCRLVRERIVTRYGHVIWRTRRVCD